MDDVSLESRANAIKTSIPYLLQVAARQGVVIHSAIASWTGVHPAESYVLLELWREQPLSQAELSRRLDIGHATIRKTLSRLIDNGLVQRTASSEDRRSIMISLTPKAEALKTPMLDMGEHMNAVHDTVLGMQNSRTLQRLLIKLVTGLRDADTSFAPKGAATGEAEG